MKSDPLNQQPILVALSAEARSLRLVHAGFWLARESGQPWIALHVGTPDQEMPEESDQVRVWMQEAAELGAETLWTHAPTVVTGILKEARTRNASALVVGHRRDHWPWERLGHGTAQELRRRAPELRLVTVPLEARTPLMPFLPSRSQILGAIFGAMGILAACTGIAGILPPEFNLLAIFLVYLAGTAFICQHWGGAFGLTSCFAATLLFTLYFAPGSDGLLGLTCLITLLSGQFAVRLSLRLEHQTRNARRREAFMAMALLQGRALARCATLPELGEVLTLHMERALRLKTWILIPDGEESWRQYPDSGEALASPCPRELLPRLAPGATQSNPLEPLFLAPYAYLPLTGAQGLEGVLRVLPPEPGSVAEEQWDLLQAAAVQAVLAMERMRWVDAAEKARLESEREQTRNTLLGAISHDLRTPLSAIHGAASSLLLGQEAISESTRRDLLGMIHDESERLSRLLCDLLDLARLESGAIQASKDWQPLDEVIGAAIRRADSRSAPLSVSVDIPEDLPLVPLDGALTEQLLINLLENARLHAPGSPVEISFAHNSNQLEIVVSDRGPGIPSEYRERVFEKFFRVPGRTVQGGTGFGLAICQAIARIHGGSVRAEEREGGGSTFRVRFPLEGAPPAMPEAESQEGMQP